MNMLHKYATLRKCNYIIDIPENNYQKFIFNMYY